MRCVTVLAHDELELDCGLIVSPGCYVTAPSPDVASAIPRRLYELEQVTKSLVTVRDALTDTPRGLGRSWAKQNLRLVDVPSVPDSPAGLL